MTLFPFFEPIDDRTFLVVGGGNVAVGKLQKLQQFTDRIIVVAKETDLRPDDGLGAHLLALDVRPFGDRDLERADVVIAATGDRGLDRHIAELCQERGIPVNVVDDPELCTFVFPSLVKRGDLVVGITTGGKAPTFGQAVRQELEAQLPDDTEAIIEELYAYKQELKETVPDQKERAGCIRERLAELLAAADREETP